MTAKIIYVVALVVWIGEIVFLSFVVAPTVFQLLPREQAGALMSSVFSIYYVIGSACGVLLLLSCLVLRGKSTATRIWTVNAALVATMLLANIYAAVAVQPRASQLRIQMHAPDVQAGVKTEFDRLHQLAVMLNAGVLVGGLVVTGITASALRP